MSDYGSGDELLDDVDADELISAGSKRVNANHDDDGGAQHPSKRARQGSTHDQFDTIARSILKKDFGYDNFRHEQVCSYVPFLPRYSLLRQLCEIGCCH